MVTGTMPPNGCEVKAMASSIVCRPYSAQWQHTQGATIHITDIVCVHVHSMSCYVYDGNFPAGGGKVS